MSYGDNSLDVRRIGLSHLSLYMTIPAKYLSALGLVAGDYVETRLEGDTIIVRKLHTTRKEEPSDEKI